jgi:hypothetical protein
MLMLTKEELKIVHHVIRYGHCANLDNSDCVICPIDNKSDCGRLRYTKFKRLLRQHKNEISKLHYLEKLK